jgi:hypothetical protein
MNRDELLNELQEQARLVGMGAERELALKAQVDRLERVNAELLNALHCISLAAQDSGSTRDGMGLYARAAIAKARGEK